MTILSYFAILELNRLQIKRSLIFLHSLIQLFWPSYSSGLIVDLERRPNLRSQNRTRRVLNHLAFSSSPPQRCVSVRVFRIQYLLFEGKIEEERARAFFGAFGRGYTRHAELKLLLFLYKPLILI